MPLVSRYFFVYILRSSCVNSNSNFFYLRKVVLWNLICVQTFWKPWFSLTLLKSKDSHTVMVWSHTVIGLESVSNTWNMSLVILFCCIQKMHLFYVFSLMLFSLWWGTVVSHHDSSWESKISHVGRLSCMWWEWCDRILTRMPRSTLLCQA